MYSIEYSIKVNNRHNIGNGSGVPTNGENQIQILGNSDFEIGHFEQSDWLSPTEWGGNDNPTISSNRLNFTYLLRDVSQTVDIDNYSEYSTCLLEFAVARHRNKTDNQNRYQIFINFLDNSNNIIDTLVYPESGYAFTNGVDWHEVSQQFNLPQGSISKIRVNINAFETGFWAGQYGPRFNYVKLTLIK